jgi:hypothetical protein
MVISDEPMVHEKSIEGMMMAIGERRILAFPYHN